MQSRKKGRMRERKGYHTKGWAFGQFWWISGLDTVPKWPFVCAVKAAGEAAYVQRTLQLPERTPVNFYICLYPLFKLL